MANKHRTGPIGYKYTCGVPAACRSRKILLRADLELAGPYIGRRGGNIVAC